MYQRRAVFDLQVHRTVVAKGRQVGEYIGPITIGLVVWIAAVSVNRLVPAVAETELNGDQLVRLADRKGPHIHLVHRVEQGGASGNAYANDHEHHGRKAGAFGKLPETIFEIADE